MFSPTHSGMRRAAAVIPTILLTLTGCGGSDLSMTGSLVLSGWGGTVALVRSTQASPSIVTAQTASASSANAVASRCRGSTSVASS